MCRGSMGCVGACNGVPGGCTICREVGKVAIGMYGAQEGVGVGTREQGRVGQVVGSR